MALLGAVCLLVLLWSTPAFPQSDIRDEIETLQEGLEALKEGQKTIQMELEEIRELLLGRQTPASPRPKDITLSIEDEPYRGEKTAILTMVEFSDYQCPFCGRFFRETLPKLEQEYIKTGKVRHVFRDFPIPSIHKHATKAAEAAHCAGEQGKYWEMHDRLFGHQQALGPEELPKHVQALGLNTESFQSCLNGGKYAAKVQRNLEDGLKAGVTGTPSFFLAYTNPNEKSLQAIKMIAGAHGYDTFKQAIEALLNQPKN